MTTNPTNSNEPTKPNRMKPNRMKMALAAGVIGLTAFGATVAVPAIASAQEQDRSELSQEEREALREERQAQRAERRAERFAVVTDVLGVSAEDLEAARDDGQSLADIAAANGVAIQDVIDAIVEWKTAHIQEHVAAGDITQAEADEKIAQLSERVEEKVNSTPGERGEGQRGKSRRGNRGNGA